MSEHCVIIRQCLPVLCFRGDQKKCTKTSIWRLVLIYMSLITCSIEAQQIDCNRFKSAPFTYGTAKTCFMQGSNAINAADFTISTPKDTTTQGIRFDFNKKIFYLPLKTSEVFPNLLIYAAHECSIKTVIKENFQHLFMIMEIWLEGNQIETIFDNTFQGLSTLKRINLGRLVFYHLFFKKNNLSSLCSK